MWRRLQGPVAAKPTSKRYEAFVALEAEHWTAADPKVLSSNPASVKILYACLHLDQLENLALLRGGMRLADFEFWMQGKTICKVIFSVIWSILSTRCDLVPG